jgi:PAS domain S-box-containing protein
MSITASGQCRRFGARVLAIYGASALLGLSALAQSVARTDEAPRRVLVLHAYNYTFPATSAAADGARERLHQRSPHKIELDAEYLDLARFSEPGHERLMADFLRERYAKRQPDVVLVVAGDALSFVIKHRDSFAPGVPVVFLGTAKETLAPLQRPPDVTGHVFDLEFNLSETLALAERLQPEARRLYMIAGSAPLDRRWQAIARRVVEGRERKFETTYLFELPYDALAAEVSRIPSGAIVISLSLFRDGAGKTFVPVDVANTLAGLSAAPVYTPYIGQLGKGLLGGFSETFDSMGRAGADIALDILGGKDPSTISPRTNPENSHRVDYRAMQRWALSERNLPPGTVVLHKEPGIWDGHRNLVLTALAIFILQTVFAGALLMQRQRRRRAELLLKESEERMTFTAASVNMGLWQFNPETGELWTTEHCRALFGLGRDTLLTRETFLKAVHPEDRDAAISSLRSAPSVDRPAVQDVRIALPGGQVRWVRVRARSHSDGGNASSQLSGTFVDITDQKTAESEAALQRQEVAHLMRVSVLGELSGAIAHEINQPLTAILSNAQAALHLLALDSPDIAEAREALQDIVKDDNRAGAVIQRLRTLLKKGEQKAELVDVNDLVNATVGMLRSELITRRIEVETDLAGGLPASPGDPIQLQQVLLNLIMNAMDAMATAPMARRLITVSTRATQAGTVDILVKDGGEGLSEADQARVFEPFFTTKSRGLGLGLTICSTIVQAHGGHLTLANDTEGGALATLSLPIQEMLIAAQ